MTPHFGPEVTAATYRMEALVDALSQHHEVRVIALTGIGQAVPPADPRWHGRVSVQYLTLPRYDRTGLYGRALHEVWHALRLAWMARGPGADLIWVTSPSVFMLPAVLLLAGRVAKVADVRDLTWQYLPAGTGLQCAARAVMTRMARYCLQRFDRVTVTNRHAKAWMLDEAGLDQSRVTVLGNGISRARYESLSRLDWEPEAEPFIVTYAGNIGHGQNLMELVRAVHGLAGVRLVLIGDGARSRALQQHLSQLESHQILMTGPLPWPEVLAWYRRSSVLIARLDEAYGSAIPSKLFEYLATGLPVIYCGGGAAAELLRDFEQTTVLGPNDQQGLRQALLALQARGTRLSEANRARIGREHLREPINQAAMDIVAEVLASSAHRCRPS